MGIGHEDRGHAVRGDLEHRAPGARDGEVGRGQRVCEICLGEVFAQVIARRQSSLGELAVVAAPGHVQNAEGAAGEGLRGRPVDRARSERAAEDEHACLIQADPQPLARRVRVLRATGDRPAGDSELLAAAPVAPRAPPTPSPPSPNSGKARQTRLAQGASSRLVKPRWLSASVSTTGIRRVTAARATGPAT